MDRLDVTQRPHPTGYCETCGRIFYSLIGKLCDVPTCKGYVRHV